MPVSVNMNITPEKIFRRVDQMDIYRHYIGDVKLKEMICSPLRADDTDPSFRLYVAPNGDIRFVDYGSGMRGGVFDLVAQLNPGLNFKNVLLKVWNDLECFSVAELPQARRRVKRDRLYPELKVRTRNVTSEDVAYWNSFGITGDTLNRFGVYPIDRFWLDNALFVCRTQAFAYDLISEWKVYRPFEEKMRFVAGGPALQGYNRLPEKGEICVIQKSYKDVMLLHEFGIPSFAPQAESVDVPEGKMNDILSRFDKVFVWGDPDNSGKMFNERHQTLYGVTPVMNDDGETKDITDHCKVFGKESAETMTKRLLHM